MSKNEVYLLRRQKKILLKDVAAHLQCSVSFISKYERNERNFSKELEEKYYQYILNRT